MRCNIQIFSAVKIENSFQNFCSKQRLWVLKSTHNLCFGAKIRKNWYPCKPYFHYIKVCYMLVWIAWIWAASWENQQCGFRPGPTQTGLCSHRRWLEAWNFGFRKKRNCTIHVAKTKALISFVVNAKLICVFVFAHADCWFSHRAAHMFTSCFSKCLRLKLISEQNHRHTTTWKEICKIWKEKLRKCAQLISATKQWPENFCMHNRLPKNKKWQNSYLKHLIPKSYLIFATFYIVLVHTVFNGW